MLRRLRTGVAAAVAIPMLLTSCSSGDDDGDYQIGVISELSGAGAVFGQAFTGGLDNYVNRLNANGGVNGRQIQIVVGDTRYEPATAIAAYRKMVNSDQVLAVFGLPASNTAGAIQNLADDMKTPVIGTAILPPTSNYNFIAGLNGIQALPNELPLIEHLSTESDISSPSIAIVATDTVGGHASSDELKEAAESRGYSIDGEYFVPFDVTQFSTQAAQIRASDPDFVAVMATAGGLAVIVRALRQAGVDAPIVNCHTGSSELTLAELKDPELYLVRDYADPAEDVSKAMRDSAIEQDLPDGTELQQGQVYTQGYVMGQLIESVLKECGEDCSPEKFRDALETSASEIDTKGLTGRTGFSPDSHVFLHEVKYFHWDTDQGRGVPVDGLPLADAAG